MSEHQSCLEFIERIDRLKFSPDDLAAEERLYKLIDLLDDVANPSSVFPAIFRFFERNEGAEIGNPGPLVHFIEKFYPSYLDLLCDSIASTPVEHTVWMVNRILNDSAISHATRDSLLDLLETTRDNTELPEAIRKDAGGFLAYQNHS